MLKVSDDKMSVLLLSVPEKRTFSFDRAENKKK